MKTEKTQYPPIRPEEFESKNVIENFVESKLVNKEIEFRFVKSGMCHIPEFRQPKQDNVWKRFTVGKKDVATFTENGILGKLAYALASINNNARWSGPTYHFRDTRQVYFLEEFQVMAFLGGAKSYFTQQIINPDL